MEVLKGVWWGVGCCVGVEILTCVHGYFQM